MATIRHAVIDQEIDDDIAGQSRAKADYLANPGGIRECCISPLGPISRT